jgi:hypothetical protein
VADAERLEERALLSGSGWLVTSSVVGADPVTDLAQDSAGNTYVTGYFSGTMTIGTTVLTSNGSNEDIFVAKLDPSGNLLWAQRFGGTGQDFAEAIDVGSDGAAYVAGSFAGTTTIGSDTLTSVGVNDVLVFKLDDAGVPLWARRGGGADPSSSYMDDRAHGIALDSIGNVYVGANFKGTADFGATTLTAAGGSDQALIKMSDAGAFLWAQQLGGAAADESAGAISIDASDNVYVGGNILARYDAAGSLIWNNATTERRNPAVYQDGSTTYLYASGVGGISASVSRLDAATGAVLWSEAAPFEGMDSKAAVDVQGNVYVVGAFFSDPPPPDFDPGPGTFVLENGNPYGYNSALLKLDSAGNFVSARRIVGGTGGYQFARDVEVNAAGDVFVSGEWGGTADFDLGDSTAVRTSTHGDGQGFVLKMTQGLGAVSGSVFHDINGNGIRDANEPALANATVFLDQNGNGALDPGELWAVSSGPKGVDAATGTYLINHVPAGSYTLRQLLPAGWTQTSPAGGYSLTLGTDQFVGGKELGAYFPSQSFTYTSADVPKRIPTRQSQYVDSKLTVADSYPIFGVQVSYTATATPRNIDLIAPDGTSMNVLDPQLRNYFNGKDVRGTWTLRVWNSTSGNGSLTSWSLTVLGAQVPQIGSLTASPNPVNQGSTLTLTANSVIDRYPGGSVSSVLFYLDSNGNGRLDSGDLLVGTDTSASGGWSLTVSTTNLATGTYTFFAQAQDNLGILSTAAATSVTVQKKGKASGAMTTANASGSSLTSRLTDQVFSSNLEFLVS